MTDTQPTASGVSEEMTVAFCKSFFGESWTFAEVEQVKEALEAALSAKPAQTEQIASVRGCVEWAIPQLNCGNMSKDEFFDYLVSLFGTISAHEAVRDMQERWRRDKSERDHLRYVLSREPVPVVTDEMVQKADSEYCLIYLEMTKKYPGQRFNINTENIRRILRAALSAKPAQRGAHLEDILRDAMIGEPFLHNGKWCVTVDDALAGMTAVMPPQPIPTPDEALRDSEIPLDWLTVRAILLAVRPDWKPHSGGEATDDSRAYELTELVIRQTMRHMMRSTCSHCKTKKWTWNFYRCWDCKTYLCEGCIKYHFGSGHIPHPKTIEQFEAEIAALSRARPEKADSQAEITRLEADIENREARRQEILDFLQEKIGTAWTCANCGYSSYHASNNECEECSTPFPLLNLLAFKLHASHTDAKSAHSPAPRVEEATMREMLCAELRKVGFGPGWCEYIVSEEWAGRPDNKDDDSDRRFAEAALAFGRALMERKP